MTTQPFPIDERDLLAQAGRLRALAQQLLRDAHFADDVVQDTYAKALEDGPADAPALARWTRRVVRNFATERKRAAANRAARERFVARHEALPSAADSAERLEAIEIVAKTLRELAEPYRSTLTRTFVDDLSPREIARLDGVSEATIRWRVHHGLALMRKELDQRFGGDREQWGALLLPLAARPRGPVAELVRWCARSHVLLASAATVAALLAAWLFVAQSREDEPNSIALAAGSASERDASSSPVALATAPDARALVPSDGWIEVRAVRVGSLEPVANAELRCWPLPAGEGVERMIDEWFASGLLEDHTHDASTYTTDGQGVARVARGEHGLLVTASAGTLWGKAIAAEGPRAPVVVELRPDADVAVRVLDADHNPVGDALLELAPLAECSNDYHDWMVSYVRAHTREGDGRAVLPHVGWIKNSPDNPCAVLSELSVSYGGSWLHHELDRDGLRTDEIDLVLPHTFGFCEFIVIGATPDERVHHVDVAFAQDGADTLWGQSHEIARGYLQLPVPVGRQVDITLPEELLWQHDDCERCVPYGHSFVVDQLRKTLRVHLQRVEASALRDESVQITGWLVDEHGWTIANAAVSVGLCSDVDEPPTWARARSLASAHSDEGGRFSVGINRPTSDDEKDHVIVVMAHGPVAGTLFGATQERVRKGAVAIDLGEVRCAPMPVVLSGRVVTAGGTPIAGASIHVTGDTEFCHNCHTIESSSDAAGAFVVQCMAELTGDLAVRVTAPGFAPFNVLAAPGTRELHVTLHPPSVLKGRVLVDSSIRPSSVWLKARTVLAPAVRGEQQTAFVSQCVLNADGTFTLSGLAPGEYSIAVTTSAPYDLDWSMGEVQLEQVKGLVIHEDPVEHDPRLNPLDLRRGFRRVVVRVQDETGAPVADASTSVRDPRLAWGGSTDAAGEDSLLVSTAGVTVEVCAKGYFHQIVEGVARDTTISLTRRPTVRLALAEATRQPDELLGFAIAAQHADSNPTCDECNKSSAIFDASGVAELQVPSPDQIVVQLSVFEWYARDEDPPRSSERIAIGDDWLPIHLTPGRTEPYVITAPRPSELAEALRRLRREQ